MQILNLKTQKLVRITFLILIIVFITTVYKSIGGEATERAISTANLYKEYLSYKLEDFNTSGALFAAVGKSASKETSEEADQSFHIESSIGHTSLRIPVLVYHRLPKEEDGFNVTAEKFEEQMRFLKDRGWNTISLDEYKKIVEKQRDVPQKTFLLSFDDGAKESYYPADPLLRFLNFRAVMFVLPKYSLKKDTGYYVSEYDLERMIKSGRWEIGSHGFDSHSLVAVNDVHTTGTYMGNRMWLDAENRMETDVEFRERIEKDLSRSKNSLEQAFGISVDSFAYPFGDFGQRSSNSDTSEETVKIASGEYYNFVFAQAEEGMLSPVETIPGGFLIRRIRVNPNWTVIDLLEEMEKFSKTD